MSGDICIAIDFGSTYTKLVALDLATGAVVGSAYTPTTSGDIRKGLRKGLSALEAHMPEHEPAAVFACSSAAGGLRIVVVGLVPALSVAAAQQAALGAGGKIVGAFGRRLAKRDLEGIRGARPDVIILAGGTDGGEETTIRANADALAAADVAVPIVVAGNQAVADDCAELLRHGGVDAIVTSNLLPEVGRVDSTQVHKAVRDLFMSSIIHAKGLSDLRDVVSFEGGIIPTPVAVLAAAEIIAVGGQGGDGAGELLVVDVGGATTDVHSVAAGGPTTPGTIVKGLPEPYVKRTVEGDLGLRANLDTIVERAGLERLEEYAADLGAAPGSVGEFVQRAAGAPSYVPHNGDEAAADAALARAAVETAVRRHAGRLNEIYTGAGRISVQQGKDLQSTRLVIGIGGALSRGPHADFILGGALVPAVVDDGIALVPRQARFVVDRRYLLYAIGLVAGHDRGAAERIAHAVLADSHAPQSASVSGPVQSAL